MSLVYRLLFNAFKTNVSKDLRHIQNDKVAIDHILFNCQLKKSFLRRLTGHLKDNNFALYLYETFVMKPLIVDCAFGLLLGI